ncbi:MAG: collagen-like protein, partial [Hyphomicrobiales bacterium]|nr:collagen-like protein [Hyphomicrobiales bacterium]
EADKQDATHLNGLIDELKAENQQLKLMIAEMKAALAEVTAKNNEMRFIVDRLRIESKGDPGPPGPMGRDGRDGVQGPPGEKGAQGNRGQRGFETTGWLVDEEEYCITPLYYDNTKGPTLNLRGLFERYSVETEDDEISLASERAALSRAQLAVELERLKRGLPPK